jgi:hypothetical protein
MKRILVAVAVGSAIGAGGIALAQDAYRGPEKVTTLSEQDVGDVHRVARNPSTTTKTRVLAVVLHPRDAKELTTPAEESEP